VGVEESDVAHAMEFGSKGIVARLFPRLVQLTYINGGEVVLISGEAPKFLCFRLKRSDILRKTLDVIRVLLRPGIYLKRIYIYS